MKILEIIRGITKEVEKEPRWDGPWNEARDDAEAYCPRCDYWFDCEEPRYCPDCGQRIVWM